MLFPSDHTSVLLVAYFGLSLPGRWRTEWNTICPFLDGPADALDTTYKHRNKSKTQQIRVVADKLVYHHEFQQPCIYRWRLGQ